MSVREHKSGKKNFLSLCKVVLWGLDKPRSRGYSRGAVSVSMLHTSTQKVPLPMQQRRAGLRRVFLTPQARCRLRRSQQLCFTQADDNSVWSLTCVDSSVLTKPKHCYKSISPKQTEYREKAHLLSKAGQLPYNHFRVWFNIHDSPRRWQFWIVLQSSLACACLGKVLQGMLYFLWKKAVVNMMLSVFGGSVTVTK